MEAPGAIPILAHESLHEYPGAAPDRAAISVSRGATVLQAARQVSFIVRPRRRPRVDEIAPEVVIADAQRPAAARLGYDDKLGCLWVALESPPQIRVTGI